MNDTPKKPALVIGNGPSVDLLDPKLLDHFTTYGCNHIYMKFRQWGRPTDHVLITDSNRIAEMGSAYCDYPVDLHVGHHHYSDPPISRIRNMLHRDFIPLRQLMRRRLSVYPLLRRVYWPDPFTQLLIFDKMRFTFSQAEGLNFGSSVTISAIQLAVIHGHRVICLTGVDSAYASGKDYFVAMKDNIHYVNTGFIADPRRYMEPTLVLLQLYLERLNVTLLDCTPSGKLHFIPKGTLLDSSPWYQPLPHRLS